MLQETQHQHRQELHVLSQDELRTRSRTARHCRLVRDQDVNQLVHDGVPRVLQLALHAPLHRLVRQQCRHSDRVDAPVQLGDRVGRGKGEGEDSDAALAVAGRVEDGGLEDDKGRVDRVLDLDLDGVRLVDRDGREGEKVGRTDEEVAVEGGHADTCSERGVKSNLRSVRRVEVDLPLDARTRMTASRQMGSAMTVPNSCANLRASSGRPALKAG